MADLITPVLLSGGSGTRLWPMSRTLYPKQLLPLVSDHSMLVETAHRLVGKDLFSAPIIVCNEEHRFIVAEQLRQAEIQPRSIVLEPVGRNSAPAVAIAALLAEPDELMLIASSDHVVPDIAAYHEAVRIAAAAARAGGIAIFGIVPTHPDTSYGYIDRGEPGFAEGAYKVSRFVEKPDLATAESYLAAGTFLWNSGMFLFRADRMIEELERFQPEILAACRKAIAAAKTDLDFLRLDEASFRTAPAISIDYAVMEHTAHAAVVPATFRWSDVGSWSSLWELGDKDESGNVMIGDAVAVEVRNSYIRADGRLVAVLGLDDVVVVNTDDAVLVAHRDRVQDVKKVVERLKANNRPEPNIHRLVYRPWGSYQGVDGGERFQVKRITVKPGQKLSLQMHHHRAEHWVVVSGTARVTRDEGEEMVFENQSIYIPMGCRHRVENPGKVPLQLIEVQSGAYLGEDDIVRFEDDYGRG